jgi:hypothetical protein
MKKEGRASWQGEVPTRPLSRFFILHSSFDILHFGFCR